MAEPNWVNRTLWTGDNLDVMRGMNSASQSGILVNLHLHLYLVFGSDVPNKFGHQDQMNNLLRGHT